jgi:uncharacterized protein
MRKPVQSRIGPALPFLFVAVAFGLSWLVWSPLVAASCRGRTAWPYLHLIGALGPAVAALTAAAVDGRSALKGLLSRFNPRRSRTRWLVLAALGPVALYALAALALKVVGQPWPGWQTLGTSREYADLGRAGYWAANIVFYGYGEEIGWRGYLLPRLQGQNNALVSALVVSVLWALWHLPLFWFAAGMRAMGPAEIGGWFFSIVTGSILMTWLFNSSGGSVTVVALFHGVLDIVITSPGAPALATVMGAALTVWGIAIVVVARPANLARCARQTEPRN